MTFRNHRIHKEVISVSPSNNWSLLWLILALLKRLMYLRGLISGPILWILHPLSLNRLPPICSPKMGLETRLTQPSRDAGVDYVALDPRPIFGGIRHKMSHVYPVNAI